MCCVQRRIPHKECKPVCCKRVQKREEGRGENRNSDGPAPHKECKHYAPQMGTNKKCVYLRIMWGLEKNNNDLDPGCGSH